MTQSPNPFEGMSKLLEHFHLPGLDIPALTEARRKDVAALVEANRIAFEGMQALAAKQVEIFQSTMAELQAALPGTGSSGQGPDSKEQAERAQRLWQRALTDMRDMAELARKSQVDALATIGQRATQNL